jgi:hypothetical protein
MERITLNIETSLFEEHKNLIERAIWKNRPLLSALRIEDEDAAQQLAIAMLKAIRRYDAKRFTSLAVYLGYYLQYEILNIKRRYRPYGIKGAPKGYNPEMMFLDVDSQDDYMCGIPCNDDLSGLEFSELSDCLSDLENEAVTYRIQGYPLRRKVHTDALDSARRKYVALYLNEA